MSTRFLVYIFTQFSYQSVPVKDPQQGVVEPSESSGLKMTKLGSKKSKQQKPTGPNVSAEALVRSEITASTSTPSDSAEKMKKQVQVFVDGIQKFSFYKKQL